MITRLRVDGFKNLVNIDIYLGPFNCFAGENGVGKSNIFDVLQFLSYLADYPVVEAIEKIRSEGEYGISEYGVRSIFRTVNGAVTDTIKIELEMIVPERGIDELGQEARATSNFLRYELELKFYETEGGRSQVAITTEVLDYITQGNAAKNLPFEHAPAWREKVIYNSRRSGPYISTERQKDGSIYINLHQDGGSRGKPNPFAAANLPRTVLSTARYASETPTLLMARREMQSWKFLQLEPSALRRPDDLDKVNANIQVRYDGAHLPGTVYRISQDKNMLTEYNGVEGLYATLASRLSELIPNVEQIRVDKDEKRRILTLEVITQGGNIFPARSLSDGTLRFLALAILELDETQSGLICLEEPENGIHPARISAVISLLKDIAVDPTDPEETILQQVIVNTHSPVVVSEIPESALIYVGMRPFKINDARFEGTYLSAFENTWRTAQGHLKKIRLGEVLAYLSPIKEERGINGNKRQDRVKDRSDLQKIIQGNLFEEVL